MAKSATSILNSPDTALSPLKTLNLILKHKNKDVVRLAVLTNLAVYRDIIPGYRFRPPTAEEQKLQLSKEVKRVRDWENALLKYYQEFLLECERLVNGMSFLFSCHRVFCLFMLNMFFLVKPSKASKSGKANLILVKTTVHALGTLLLAKPHFNYRSNLITLLATQSSRKDIPFADFVEKTFKTLFRGDVSGEFGLETVKIISRYVNGRVFRVAPQLVACFTSLRLRDELHLDDIGKKRKKNAEGHQSRKMRRIIKHEREVEREMLEAEAVVDRDFKQKLQTETLKHVFTTYFRILKKAGRESPLMSTVLEGLSSFAHLINIEFFTDLLSVLRSYSVDEVKGAETFSPKMVDSLHCLITVFKLLSGQGEALNIDLKDFLSVFYNTIGRGTYDEGLGSKEMELICLGLELAFLKRFAPKERAASFLKRMCTLALLVDGDLCVACLAVIKQILTVCVSLGYHV